MGQMKSKTLPGFMELLPNDQVIFNEMKEKIQKSYERFGFLPLDTPIIEYEEVLLAKAGGETEKQIYRFSKGENDLALRFDLTVPLAKYVTQNYHELNFPFRRYQIGKVYRGEKPQKGRFREFYQCDIDIIGEGELSVVNDAEIPSVIYHTIREIGFDKFTICMNHRKLLNGLFESLELEESSPDIIRIIDKIEKIGEEKVVSEIKRLGVEQTKIDQIIEFIRIDGTTDEKLKALQNLNFSSSKFEEGLEEITQVVEYIRLFGVPDNNFKIDLTIARGLDYYTGIVYETFLDEYKSLGSICSGGRYDDLAGFYTDKKMPGVGISIGLTRLFYQLNERNLTSPDKESISDVIVLSLEEGYQEAVKVATRFREEGINTQVYFGSRKIKAQFKYADRLKIPYTAIVGEEETKNHTVTLKDMETGQQEELTMEQAINKIKEKN